MTEFFVITIITILFGTLCQCHDYNISKEIIDLKNAVESVVNDSKIWRVDLFSNYTSYFQNIKDSEFEDFNATVDEAYENSRSNIAAAEREGRDVNHCFEPIESQLSNSQMAVYDKMDTYMNNASSYFRLINIVMDANLSRQRRRLPNLDTFLSKWVNLHYTEMNQWMGQRLAVAREKINRYKNNIEALQNTFPPVLMIVFSEYSDQFKSEMRDIKSVISAVKLAVDECIRNS